MSKVQGQGCAQFISPKINFNNVRFDRCDLPEQTPVEPVPEPLTIFGAGTAVAFGTSFKRKLAKAKSKKK